MSGPFGSGAFGTGSFSSSPLYSTKTLIDKILRFTNHKDPSVETARRLVVLDCLQNVYARVTGQKNWDWLYQTVDFNFEAPYETGTVALTQGSESVVGTGTVFSANVIPNNVFVPGGRSESYVISSVESATGITLEGEYAGATALESSYKVIKPMYRLPADCEQIQSIVLDGYGEMVPVGTQEFRRIQARDVTATGMPRWYTDVGRRATDGVRTIEVYPAPDKKYIAQLNYGVNIIALQDSETNYPLIPDRHRVVLYHGALSQFAGFLRDQSLMTKADKDYETAYFEMKSDNKLTDSRLILTPARNYINDWYRGGVHRNKSASDFAKD